MFSLHLLLLEKKKNQQHIFFFFKKSQNKRPLHKIAQSQTLAIKGK